MNDLYAAGKRWLYRFLSLLPGFRQVRQRLNDLQAQLAQSREQVASLERRLAYAEGQLAGIHQDANGRYKAGLMDAFFKTMTQEESADAWLYFNDGLGRNYDAFSESLGKNVPPEQLLPLLSRLLVPIARNGLKNYEIANALFYEAQAMGVHLLPVHFYSPVPNTLEIPEQTWNHRFERGWNINENGQLEMLKRLAVFAGEIADIPEENPPGPHDFYWNNPALGPVDAVTYYAMLRELQPKRVLEVGGGYSTMLAARAALKNGHTRLEVIEPFPLDALKSGFPGLERLLIAPVQDVDPLEFESLQAGDVLFIDSTHICKTGSDVNWLVLEILPRLQAGVVIHFHDILLPWVYPRNWVEGKRIFWNEEYLLQAFLMFNPDFEVLIANFYLGNVRQEALRAAYPFLKDWWGAGSFWMRKLK